jgi:TPP-dependent indolepyruvate ferredoxin oxidoreductase alpha subunit
MVTLHDRKDMDAVQRELREIEGCSVLIYDQTCAAEKRRRRKKANSPTRISVCSSTTPYVKAAAIAVCNPTVPR